MYKSIINYTLMIIWVVFLVLKIGGVINWNWWIINSPMAIPILCLSFSIYFGCRDFKEFQFYEQNHY